MLKKITLSFILFFCVHNLLPVSANAAPASELFKNAAETSANEAGYENVKVADDQSFEVVIGKIVKIILSFLGIFFLILMIYAGFLWMFSRGNSSEVEKSKKIMENAIWGILVIIMAYAITNFVMSIMPK